MGAEIPLLEERTVKNIKDLLGEKKPTNQVNPPTNRGSSYEDATTKSVSNVITIATDHKDYALFIGQADTWPLVMPSEGITCLLVPRAPLQLLSQAACTKYNLAIEWAAQRKSD